jgi:hypothetical protein
MTTFKTKPMKVEAFRLPVVPPGDAAKTSEYPGWLQDLMAQGLAWRDGAGLMCSTQGGGKRASDGNWVVKTPAKDVRVYSDEAFMAAFDLSED